MTQEQIIQNEVRPNNEGWYFVTLFQFKKQSEKDVDEFNDFIYFDGNNYDYTYGYEGCYVSKIIFEC